MKKLKIKKPSKPNLKAISKLKRRAKSVDERVTDAINNVPRITNDTVADHREDVLSSARKYIYPLQHSKHSIVRISVTIFVVVVVGFFVFCGLDLYKFQGKSGFIYDVSTIIPFPVAKTGSSWVSYRSYLFELRRNMHYYETQQQASFSGKNGKEQLTSLKQQALNYAVQVAQVKQLAKQNHVSVTDQAVDNEVSLLKSENRLGTNNHVFAEVLNQYYGWSEDDFKEELGQEMLSQAVVAKLDTQASVKAQDVLGQLQSGVDFATLASKVSEDASTKTSGGQYSGAITIDDQQVSPAITSELFKLKAGQTSGIIDTGYSLDIVKVIDREGTSLHAAHIQFNLNSINTYLAPLQHNQKLHKYIKV